MEDIMDLNRKIVHLGEQFHKPVVGTCDVHFMDPEDEVYAGSSWQEKDLEMPISRHHYTFVQRRKCWMNLPTLVRKKRMKL